MALEHVMSNIYCIMTYIYVKTDTNICPVCLTYCKKYLTVSLYSIQYILNSTHYQ